MPGLADRRSIAHRRRHALAPAWLALIRLLRQAKLVAAEIAARLPLARSTVSAVLSRLGLARLSYLNPPPPVQRYEWEQPGAMIHVDIKKLGRIGQPSHRVTGNRRHSLRGVGWEYMHVAIDDCSRYTYAEILPDDKRYTATAFWLRAVREFRRRGIRVQRVLTDNGGAYRSRPFRKACRWLGITTKRGTHAEPDEAWRVSCSCTNTISRRRVGSSPTSGRFGKLVVVEHDEGAIDRLMTLVREDLRPVANASS